MRRLRNRDLEAALRWKRDYGGLKEKIGPVERILNVGCGDGRETFALMWALGAREVVGIDKDPSAIEAARGKLSRVQRGVEKAVLVRRHWWDWTSEEDRRWWRDEVPEQLRKEVYAQFREADITRAEEMGWMEPGTFDLVYCDHVLDKIERDGSDAGLRAAVGNMVRAAKKNGWIVAVPPRGRVFEGLFGEFDVDVEARSRLAGTVYLCRKW